MVMTLIKLGGSHICIVRWLSHITYHKMVITYTILQDGYHMILQATISQQCSIAQPPVFHLSGKTGVPVN